MCGSCLVVGERITQYVYTAWFCGGCEGNNLKINTISGSTVVNWARYVVTSVTFLFISAIASAASSDNIPDPVKGLFINPLHISSDHANWVSQYASELGFNLIIFRVTPNLQLANSPNPQVAQRWSLAELGEWVHQTRRLGLEIVPEIKLLTHQEKFFGSKFPDLMYNNVTYDPSKPAVYDVVLPFLEEVIDIFNPKAIHIGHDEVAGHHPRSRKKWLSKNELTLTSDLFLDSVSTLHQFLGKKNVKTWMWGDMLVGIEEFPNMLPRHLHGNLPGYGRELRQKLSKDIVILDWHYFDPTEDFQTVTTLRKEGFQVLACVWDDEDNIRNFSRYAAENGASGIILTPWRYMLEKNREKLRSLMSFAINEFHGNFKKKLK